MVYDYISQDSPDKYNRGKGRKKEREGGVGGREGEKGREEGRREKEREGDENVKIIALWSAWSRTS